VDISKLEPGQQIRVEWRGKPVWVVKRTKQTLDALAAHDDKLRDPASEPQQPDYAHNGYRSIKPEIFVAVGICTHLGCSLPIARQLRRAGSRGNFRLFCPCHGSKFDMAGRVFQGVPAP
jgi:ubiquinol-cytochrome c reductase iron-sulfur subunit